MFIVYDLIFLAFSIIYFPVYLFKRKFHRGFLLRLGILPKDIQLNNPIWIHAVSVGEVMAIKELVKELKKVYPTKKFVISTVTPTGNKIAVGIAGKEDFVTYLPLDFSFIVRRSLNRIKPSLFIIAETEIWPNLITQLYKRKIPLILVNARISDRAFSGYRKIKLLVKPVLEKLSLFCAQTDRDAQRFQALGVPREKIRVTGNMKFDTTDYTDKRITDYTDYKTKLGLKDNEKILVAGSTHPGEEEIILGVYKKLLDEFSDARLLIAPRHPERSGEVQNIVIKYGFNPLRVSQFASLPVCQLNRPAVFILDTIGELLSFYAIADIVFVGGSLSKKGGHNILEPATGAKPILFGPYMFNFRDIAELFLDNRAAVQVNSQEELKIKIKELLSKPEEAADLGRRGRDLISKNRGATQRTLDIIKRVINE
jgi:3-deoxy-D-manno-octulosonic-acid transferase